MDEQNKTGKAAGKHIKEDPRAAKKAAKAEAARLEQERKQAEKEAEAARKAAVKEAKQERKAQEKQGKKKSAAGTAFLVLLIFLLLGAGGVTGAGWYITNRNTNLDNVYIGEYNVGGLTQAETLQLLQDKGWDASQEGTLHVTLPTGARFKLDYLEAGANHSAEVLAATANSYGHNGGWLTNLVTYVENKISPIDVNNSAKVLNSTYILARVRDGIQKYDAYMADTEYHLDLDRACLRWLKGAGSVKLDENYVYTKVAEALLAGQTELTVELENPACAEPDFTALSKELNVEVQDAYFDESFNIIPEVSGIILDPAVAQQVWDATPVTEYAEIPVTLHEPSVVAADLQALLYRDMLATTTTSYQWSTENRINNINLAVEKINGTILLPGEVFSYNGTVGERTAEAGFKMAGAYASGQVVQQLGGGICQVSSTLYKTTLLAQMETVARTCHQFRVTYLEPGYDATVNWPSVDFKFRNAREYPVKIVAYCDNDACTVTIELWGTDVDGSYVQLTYGTGVIYDPQWKALGYEVKTGTSAACNVWLYDKDGNLIKSYVEDYSVYNLHEEDIKTPNGWTLEEAKEIKRQEEEEAKRRQEEAENAANAGDDYAGDF